jgi:hypothetical protein
VKVQTGVARKKFGKEQISWPARNKKIKCHHLSKETVRGSFSPKLLTFFSKTNYFEKSGLSKSSESFEPL